MPTQTPLHPSAALLHSQPNAPWTAPKCSRPYLEASSNGYRKAFASSPTSAPTSTSARSSSVPRICFLIQDDNSTTMGGAFLPQVNGSQLKPALIDVTQFPLAGEARDQNTVTVVTVTGTIPSTNQTLSCQWRVTVQNIDNNLDGWYVWFTANNGNTNYMESFDLQYPVLGKFFGVGSMTFLYNYAMTLRSSLTATFKRINASNATDSSVLQTIRVRGNNVSDFVEYSDNPVSFPDYTNRYQVEVKARGFIQTADVYVFLFTQEKKLIT